MCLGILVGPQLRTAAIHLGGDIGRVPRVSKACVWRYNVSMFKRISCKSRLESKRILNVEGVLS